MHLEIKQTKSTQETVATNVIRKLYELSYHDGYIDRVLDNTSILQGNLLASAAYENEIDFLNTEWDGELTVSATKLYLKLKDPTVAQYCISNYSSDGIGVTRGDLSSVQSAAFWGDPEISNQSFDKSQVTSLIDFQYFTNSSIGSSQRIVYGFTNATEIKFPDIIFSYTSPYTREIVNNCDSIQNIDYGNSTFVCQSNDGTLFPIRGNNVITDFDPKFIPNQTDFTNIELFRGWSNLTSIVFPEGVTKSYERFNGTTNLKYVEFPSTITDLGTKYNMGRDGSNSYVIVFKSTTPPTAYYRPNDNSYNQGGWGWHKLPIRIFVPDDAIEAYKNVQPLSIGTGTDEQQLIWVCPDIKNIIYGLSDLVNNYPNLMQYCTIPQDFIDAHMPVTT